MGVVGAEVDAVTDSLIEKVVSIEKRADELVERARAQVKEIQEETARRLKELQSATGTNWTTPGSNCAPTGRRHSSRLFRTRSVGSLNFRRRSPAGPSPR